MHPVRRHHLDSAESRTHGVGAQVDAELDALSREEMLGDRPARARQLVAEVRDRWSDLLHRLDDPVDPRIVEELYENFAEFRKAYDEDGLSTAEFTEYGATARTLRQFLAANTELEAFVRDVTIANPDK